MFVQESLAYLRPCTHAGDSNRTPPWGRRAALDWLASLALSVPVLTDPPPWGSGAPLQLRVRARTVCLQWRVRSYVSNIACNAQCPTEACHVLSLETGCLTLAVISSDPSFSPLAACLHITGPIRTCRHSIDPCECTTSAFVGFHPYPPAGNTASLAGMLQSYRRTGSGACSLWPSIVHCQIRMYRGSRNRSAPLAAETGAGQQQWAWP